MKDSKNKTKREHIYVDLYLEEREDKDIELNEFFELIEQIQI